MRGVMRTAVTAAILVAIWAAASRLAQSPLFPGPLDVARSLAAALVAGTLARAVVTSALRLVVGYAIALAAGVPLGLVLARSDGTKRALGPLLLGLSSVPSICWLPLAIVWFGLSEAAIQVVIVLGAALPVTLATESAVRQLPPTIERAARTMGARGPDADLPRPPAGGDAGHRHGREDGVDVRAPLAHGGRAALRLGRARPAARDGARPRGHGARARHRGGHHRAQPRERAASSSDRWSA